MNLTDIKRIVSSSDWSKKLAEPLLNVYVLARYCVKKQYTRDGEDRAAMAILEKRFHLPPSQVRYFDFGASHYMRGNNTYLFSRQGAYGVLVEADPFLCGELRKNRPMDETLNAAIVDVPPPPN